MQLSHVGGSTRPSSRSPGAVRTLGGPSQLHHDASVWGGPLPHQHDRIAGRGTPKGCGRRDVQHPAACSLGGESETPVITILTCLPHFYVV